MNAINRLRARVGRVSLGKRLPASFAGVALLTMLVLGAILVPLLGNYYARSEVSYLQAGAERAVRDLSAVDWAAVAAEVSAAGGATTGGASADARRRTQAVALATQLRIQVVGPDGTLLVDSGSVNAIDPAGIVQGRDDDGTGRDGDPSSEGEHSRHGLPSPLGGGLFGGPQTEDGPRSERTTETPLTGDGRVIATVRLSEGPAYGSTALQSTLVAWLVAGVAAVLLAALVGWMASRRLTRPILAITAASDSMAHGDLAVRAKVDRADEIGSLAGSFNTMADKMQHTVSGLRRFVADAAHELGTPLTALEADLELAQDQGDEAERSRLIGRAMRQAERMDRLSNDLLRLSRLDTGTMQPPMEAMDLVPLVRQMADSVASRAEQAGIEFMLDLPSHEMRAKAHADELRTAIGNLLDNALKFTPSGGSVRLGTGTECGNAVIWVEDTGIGILPDDMGGLFGRFHRGRNVSAYPGSGLGLAIVQATMEAHSGTVAVESSANGSRFELRLPLL
jgi:signal transduction histidine kinase